MTLSILTLRKDALKNHTESIMKLTVMIFSIMPHNLTTHSIMALSIKSLSIMILNILTHSTMRLSIKKLNDK
jgi:hypothetical protein